MSTSGTLSLFEEVIEKLSVHLSKTLNLEVEEVRNAMGSYDKETVSKKKPPVETDVTPEQPRKRLVAKKSTVNCCHSDKNNKLCKNAGKVEVDGKMMCGVHSKLKTEVKKPVPKTKTATKNIVNEKTEELVNRLIKPKTHTIKKNKFGNFVNHKTNIVFDRETSIALGNQEPNGTIGDLSPLQISECEINNWKFKEPVVKNLGKKVPTQPPAKETVKKIKKPPVLEEEDEVIELEVDDEELIEEENEEEENDEEDELELEDDELELEEEIEEEYEEFEEEDDE